MNDLIQIQKTQIGAENINSVNARDLHETLEVKKAFTTWIVSALDNAGAIIEEDYVKLKSSLEGSGYQFDYIITTDMSKHIAMMSKVPKAKEVRDYFISIEKQSQKILTIPEQIVLIAQGHQQIDSRIDALEHKIDNDIPLTSSQKHNIKQKVSTLVYQLKKNHNLHDSFVPKCYSRVWKKVKNHFVVSSYMDIPKSQFSELVRVVDTVAISDVV
jgi:phage anti-repressor protein